MRSERFDFDDNGAGALELPNLGNGSLSLVPSQCPGILEANHQHLFSQTMEMISANVPRQRRAEMNILDGAQEGELPLLQRIAGPALVPAVVEFEDPHHLGYYEAMRTFFAGIILMTSCAALRADFSYQESTQMTGGALVSILRLGGPFTRKAREPIVSTVLIKGNRMATLGKDTSTIIDLDKETITEINLSKKNYSVMTFAQMRQAMDDAMARAQAEQKKRKAEPQGSQPNVDAKFKVSAKATGKTKSVQNLTAKEMVITMDLEGTDKDTGQSGSLTVINDAWMANVPGYEQVKAFRQKMAQKLAREFQPELSRMAMSDPRMMQGMSEAAKEMSKVAGVPVETVMKMGSGITVDTTDSSSEKGPSVRDAITSSLPVRTEEEGPRAGAETRRKNDQKQSGPALLLQMTTDMSDFSTGAVDMSKFDVPSGFKQVDSDLVARKH